jgi:hypothetical protein
MPGKTHHLRFLALLFGVFFLTAQFHYCAEVTSGSTGSHICPLCSTVGSAIAPQVTSMPIVPVVNRLEVVAGVSVVFPAFPRTISPRAPPSV